MPRRYTDDALRAAVSASTSWREVGQKLGRGPTATTNSLRRHAADLGLDVAHLSAARRANPQAGEVLERIVASHGPAGITFGRLHKQLADGGEWGPAVHLSNTSLVRELARATWLAPRVRGQAYVHKDHADASSPELAAPTSNP
jgi:hypothetical protein